MDTSKCVEIYTDGACSGNPGPGGWGVVLIWQGVEKRLSGFEEVTTNNRMELKAAIEGIKSLKREALLKIYTDSQYVKNGITLWMPKWLSTNWKNGKIKNVDLWQELNALVHQFSIEWHWVRGHSGDRYNEIADELARNAIFNNLVK